MLHGTAAAPKDYSTRLKKFRTSSQGVHLALGCLRLVFRARKTVTLNSSVRRVWWLMITASFQASTCQVHQPVARWLTLGAELRGRVEGYTGVGYTPDANEVIRFLEISGWCR